MPSSPPPAPSPRSSVTTLADARLPRRVRGILENLLRLTSAELEERLERMLAEFEQQLFRLADHARNPSIESGYLQTLRNMRLSRADLIPRYMLGLEASLARLGRDTAPAPESDSAPPSLPAFHNLSLVEHDDMDDELILRDIAQRSEAAASLPLHLLGQRFGVLGAAPAFDAERIPLGPRTLCRILQSASESLQLPQDSQHLLLRTFERKVMADYPALVEQLNAALATENVLPSLTYVPLRPRHATPAATAQDEEAEPSPAARGAGKAGGSRSGAGAAARSAGGAGGGSEGSGGGASSRPDPRTAGVETRMRPHTGWSLHDPAPRTSEEEPEFSLLQQMLRGRDGGAASRPGTPAHDAAHPPTGELVSTLHQLRAAGGVGSRPGANIADIKHEVLERVRSQLGPEAGLSLDDSDTFDLLGMLYDRIERDVRVDTLAGELIKRLQVPVLQAALQDRAFFAKPAHPARELLNTVAETGARWLADGDIDPALEKPLRRAVEHVVDKAHEDPTAFETSNRLLQHEMQQQARRSEMAERRHVEAARGKEKLEIAKRQAAHTIGEMIGTQKPQKFVRALIEQAWADVLTLTLLRNGAESDAWRDMLDTTKRIVTACCGTKPAPDPELAGQVKAALAQIGYHEDEAAAIGKRLTNVRDTEEGASRTQIAATLKARARLGEQGGEAVRKTKLPPRNAEEQSQYERVRVLPYGTWIEFTANQQGDVVRKRLSWYSPITDNALFVNLRGQRVGEQSLDSLARMLARGQARVVTVERARLVDRAWQATVGALRSLSKRVAGEQPWQAPA